MLHLSGGGMALSTAAKKEYSDLNGKIGEALIRLDRLPNMAVILIIIILTVTITNFASNVAVCNVIVPIAMTLVSGYCFILCYYVFRNLLFVWSVVTSMSALC